MKSVLFLGLGVFILYACVFKKASTAKKSVKEVPGPIPSDTANTKVLEQVAILQAVFGGSEAYK